MNSVCNKIVDLQIIIQSIPLDYHLLSETKLDESFPNGEFNLDGYKIRVRRDRDKNGGDLIVFVRRGLFVKELMTSNCVFWNAFVLNLQYQKVRVENCQSRYIRPS